MYIACFKNAVPKNEILTNSHDLSLYNCFSRYIQSFYLVKTVIEDEN